MNLALPPALELWANGVTTLSIALAARNSVHTWWTGIVGGVLFGWMCWQAQLYADVSLQGFFLLTSVLGWWRWQRGEATPGAVQSTPLRTLAWMGGLALAVAVGYGALLHHFTQAFMPYLDAMVMSLSVVAQCLLMQRRLATWPAWLLVNTLSVPLFWQRGLYLTAGLYALYWLNAWHGWWHWHRQARLGQAVKAQA
jgi:nicotinamide mononucleotide transporter